MKPTEFLLWCIGLNTLAAKNVPRQCVALPMKMEAPEVLKYYSEMRKYIEHENDLVNFRMTWFLTANGFLFTAFGVMFVKVIDLLSDSYKITTELILCVVSLLICLVGAIISSGSRADISAARQAIKSLVSIAHSTGVLMTGPAAVQASSKVQSIEVLVPEMLVPEMLVPDSDVIAYLPAITHGGSGAVDGELNITASLPRLIFRAWLFLALVVVIVSTIVLRQLVTPGANVRSELDAYERARQTIPHNMLISKMVKAEQVHGINATDPSLTTWNVEFELVPKAAGACKKGLISCSNTLDVLVDARSGAATLVLP
jgi:hypothetical protein